MKTMRIFLYWCAATLSLMVLNIDFIYGEEIERFSINVDTNFADNFTGNLDRIERTRNGNIQIVHDFNANQKRTAVGRHNRARRRARPRATNMLEMSWDDELGLLALSHSQQCVFEHSQSRSHSVFATVGENIYISTGIQFNRNYIRGAIDAWDDEKVDFDFGSNDCNPGKVCGHYTQVVWADSFKVGCGATLCNTVIVNGQTWTDATILVCNYGPAGNVMGSKPYMRGGPCSDCSPLDTCRRKLCCNAQRTSEEDCPSLITP